MNRPIKFRAWNPETKEMIPDIGLIPNATQVHFITGSDGIFINPAHSALRILMQYTGLKDKNRKEIYEGDIVNLYPEKNDKIWHRIIEWDTAAFHCRAIHTEANHPLHFHKFNPDRSWEVIGNVHANPELLGHLNT